MIVASIVVSGLFLAGVIALSAQETTQRQRPERQRPQTQQGQDQSQSRRQRTPQQGQDQGQDRRQRTPMNPETFRTNYLERIKTTLKASDKEWEVIKPRLEKVNELSRQGRMGGMMRGGGSTMGSAPRPGQRQPSAGQTGTTSANAPTRELSPIQKATTELRTLLQNEKASPGEVNAKLKALRAAKKAQSAELVRAQEALKEILTPLQEAQLVIMGILE